jgi:hypothetical protein
MSGAALERPVTSVHLRHRGHFVEAKLPVDVDNATEIARRCSCGSVF